jgi:hypothetical protein
VKASIDELERAVTVLGLKGAELDTIVNGENWDEPKFLPLFKAAEAMGAVLFFHPQPQHNFMMDRTTRYGLFNSLGVIVEDAIVVAMLIFGGVLDACPELKVCIARGPAVSHGAPRSGLARPTDARGAPSTRRAPTSAGSTTTPWWSEKALRFLLDEVGADRVVLGPPCRGIRRPWSGCRLGIPDCGRKDRISGAIWSRCRRCRIVVRQPTALYSAGCCHHSVLALPSAGHLTPSQCMEMPLRESCRGFSIPGWVAASCRSGSRSRVLGTRRGRPPTGREGQDNLRARNGRAHSACLPAAPAPTEGTR